MRAASSGLASPHLPTPAPRGGRAQHLPAEDFARHQQLSLPPASAVFALSKQSREHSHCERGCTLPGSGDTAPRRRCCRWGSAGEAAALGQHHKRQRGCQGFPAPSVWAGKRHHRAVGEEEKQHSRSLNEPPRFCTRFRPKVLCRRKKRKRRACHHREGILPPRQDHTTTALSPQSTCHGQTPTGYIPGPGKHSAPSRRGAAPRAGRLQTPPCCLRPIVVYTVVCRTEVTQLSPRIIGVTI